MMVGVVVELLTVSEPVAPPVVIVPGVTEVTPELTGKVTLRVGLVAVPPKVTVPVEPVLAMVPSAKVATPPPVAPVLPCAPFAPAAAISCQVGVPPVSFVGGSTLVAELTTRMKLEPLVVQDPPQ